MAKKLMTAEKSSYELLQRIASPNLNGVDLSVDLNTFADEFGWKPSDHISISVKGFAGTHLLIEHGLENTAVLSFISRDRSFLDLSSEEKNASLEISYNNLVDWHVYIDFRGVYFVFNRLRKDNLIASFPISNLDMEAARVDAFEKVVGRRVSPNIPALDDALMRTIKIWWLKISSEQKYKVTTEQLSVLFNAIFFVRATEDDRRRLGKTTNDNLLLRTLDGMRSNSKFRLSLLFKKALEELSAGDIPKELLDLSILSPLDTLDRTTIHELFRQFYKNELAPYRYDFSIMSKHALSRIYEHYVSMLRFDANEEPSLFPPLPQLERRKSQGSVYTPQYIASFFSRYLQNQMAPPLFRNIASVDPACGSGIFLRTLLELQCDRQTFKHTTASITRQFENISGYDNDANAVQATKLSIALLQQVLLGNYPSNLKVFNTDSLVLPELRKPEYDVVIANPPYVSWDNQTALQRENLTTLLGDLSNGKPDIYMGFIRLAIDMLKPGGYACLVIPHSILTSKSAAKLRSYVLERAVIRCIVNLASVDVFEDQSVYVILMILQRRLSEYDLSYIDATIVECQDRVGLALEKALEDVPEESESYHIFKAPQRIFQGDEWALTTIEEQSLVEKLDSFFPIDDFLLVRQGYLAGSKIFIARTHEVPEGEEDIWIPYLRDRDMLSYTVPGSTDYHLFYPFEDRVLLDEQRMKNRYPKTWERLSSEKDALSSRLSVKTDPSGWWRPTRTRPPDIMLRPKIVTPHLVLLPKFGLDSEGEYAVSRSPFLILKGSNDISMLKYFLAILNSSVGYWFVMRNSHKYREGYNMLEVGSLQKIRVPAPANVKPETMKRLLSLVEERLAGTSADIERKLDLIVAELYGLSSAERKILGIEQ